MLLHPVDKFPAVANAQHLFEPRMHLSSFAQEKLRSYTLHCLVPSDGGIAAARYRLVPEASNDYISQDGAQSLIDETPEILSCGPVRFALEFQLAPENAAGACTDQETADNVIATLGILEVNKPAAKHRIEEFIYLDCERVAQGFWEDKSGKYVRRMVTA